MPEIQRMPLDRVSAGARVVVRELRADRELRSRFMLLGVVVGAAADILQSHAKGPMLLRVRNTLVAIGREEAAHILVELSS